MITPIGQVNTMPHKAKFQAIEGTITKIYDDPKVGNGFRYESGTFKGTDGQSCKIKFTNFPPLDRNLVGRTIRISGDLSIDDYQGKKTVMVAAGSMIDQNPQGYGYQQAPAGPPQANYAQQAYQQVPAPAQNQQWNQSPPAYQQGPPAPQPQHQHQWSPPPTQHHQPPEPAHQQERHWEPETKPILGVTVGMAINNACQILSRRGVPDEDLRGDGFYKRLRMVASDIIRVCQELEAGRLAKSPAERAKSTANRSAQQPTQAPSQNRNPDPPREEWHDAPSRNLPPAFPNGTDDSDVDF